MKAAGHPERDVPWGKLIVFTDLHMVPPGERLLGLDPSERLRAGVDHVNERHPDAVGVIVTGDLTHRGDPESYLRVRSVLNGLSAPYRLMIGNHDRREAFAAAFPEAPRDRNGFVQQAFDLGDHRLILLDTALEGDDAGRSHAGVLCDRRLGWLDAELASAKGGPVILFMHHPPLAVGFPGMDRIALRNGEEFHRCLASHGNVRHIVAGHVHRTVSGSFRGVPFSIFKSPVHQQPMEMSSCDTSLSVIEPAAYGMLLLTPQGIVVHTEDYELAAGAVVAREALSGTRAGDHP